MAFTTKNDVNIIQESDSAYVSAGAGDDTYILSPVTIDADQRVTITDTQGLNTLQLVGGLSIASSQVAHDALQLTLTNGAVVTLLSASAFSFNVGGNPLTGEPGAIKNYATFAQEDLGVTAVPPVGEPPASGDEVVIGETTPTAPTYTLSADAASADEGTTATFTLTTQNVAEGTELAYTLTGIDAADLASGDLTGKAVVDADGKAAISVALAADATTEGAETLTVTLDGKAVSANTTVNDTSLEPVFSLTADAASTDEGASVIFTVVAGQPNFTYNYELTGVDAADVEGGALANTVTTDANGNGTFTVALANDRATEGVETLKAILPNTGLSASVTVNDTSLDNVAPVAEDATGAATEAGAVVTGQLLATDAEDDALTFAPVAAVEGLTLNDDGSYSFDPSLNTAAQALTYKSDPLDVVAEYTVTDALGATDTGTLTITVTPKPLTYTITADKTSAEEGATTVYTVKASEALADPVDVVFTLQPGDGGAADAGTASTNTGDFATGAFNPTTVTIEAGSDTATFEVVAVNDAKTELQESYSVKAEVAGLADPLTLSGKVVDATGAGGVGQIFTLTTGIDAVGGTSPNLKGSANSYGTDGNDTIVGVISGTDSTLTALDSINGGLGSNELKLDDIATTPAGIDLSVATISNVQTMTVRSVNNLASNATTAAFDTTAVDGLTTLNVTKAKAVYALSADTTDINVSGATDAITINGGKDITVNDATADKAITIGGTTAPAGTITVTDTKQGTGTIGIDGGTDVTVTATSTKSNGAITIGAATQAAGAVSVTSNLNGDGTAVITQADIAVRGGSTVTVDSNLTINAKNETAGNAHTFGDVTATGDGNTTSVTVNQNYAETEFTKAGVDLVKQLHTVTFKALALGKTTTVDGLTFTASKALTAAEVAQAFSNLTVSDTQSSGGKTVNGFFSGTLSSNFTSGPANGAVVVFTAIDESQTLSLDTGDVDPTETVVAGTAAVPASTSGNTFGYGAVTIDDDATAAITTVTLNGYGSADLGTANALNALETLSLANSSDSAVVATSAATLGLTVNNVNHDVSVTDAALKTLNVTATGADSTFGLTAAAVEALTVAGDKVLDLTGSTLAALKTVTVTGSAGLSIDASGAAVTSVNTTGTTGAVTADLDASKATYTGGEGVDNVTLAVSTVAKNIALGGNNDTLDASAATLTGTFTFDGGTGSNTLFLDAAQAEALSADSTFEGKISNFDRLGLGTTMAAQNVDLANLDDIKHVISAGTHSTGSTLTIKNMLDAGTLELAGVNNAGITVNMKDATGGADLLNVTVYGVGGDLTVAGVETIALTAVHFFPFGSPPVNLIADKATTVVLSGPGNLALSLDANGDLTTNTVTLVDGTAFSGALTMEVDKAGLVVKGGTGDDFLDAVADDVTLYGGVGNDILEVNGGLRVNLFGGEGSDWFQINESKTLDAYTVINGVDSGDVIALAGAASFSSTKIALSQGADETLLNYANQAVKMLGEDGMGWFQKGGNTYIVMDTDNTDGDAFVAGTDMIVMITGVYDLGTGASFNTSGTLEIA